MKFGGSPREDRVGGKEDLLKSGLRVELKIRNLDTFRREVENGTKGGFIKSEAYPLHHRGDSLILIIHSEIGIEIPHKLGIISEIAGGAKRRSERAKNVLKWKKIEILINNKSAENNWKG